MAQATRAPGTRVERDRNWRQWEAWANVHGRPALLAGPDRCRRVVRRPVPSRLLAKCYGMRPLRPTNTVRMLAVSRGLGHLQRVVSAALADHQPRYPITVLTRRAAFILAAELSRSVFVTDARTTAQHESIGRALRTLAGRGLVEFCRCDNGREWRWRLPARISAGDVFRAVSSTAGL
jgi:hypothetical protein